MPIGQISNNFVHPELFFNQPGVPIRSAGSKKNSQLEPIIQNGGSQRQASDAMQDDQEFNDFASDG